MSVLEIGCGAGRLTRALANFFGEVYAVDISGEMVKRAVRHCRIFRQPISCTTTARTYPSFRRNLWTSRFPILFFNTSQIARSSRTMCGKSIACCGREGSSSFNYRVILPWTGSRKIPGWEHPSRRTTPARWRSGPASRCGIRVVRAPRNTGSGFLRPMTWNRPLLTPGLVSRVDP